jgi:hypothetical protein
VLRNELPTMIPTEFGMIMFHMPNSNIDRYIEVSGLMSSKK